MKTKIYSLVLTAFLFSTRVFAAGEQTDSLSLYLEQAARNNPQVQSDFMLYKAALERVPQAGALPDPELEIGFYFKPMETLMGEQVADFTLMQMFPWFGTQKAARSEAQEMARMAYEKFRDSRNNLWYEVKAQWYKLSNLNEQYKNTQANILLLQQLEQLALRKFSSSSVRGESGTSGVEMQKSISGNLPQPSAGMTGMSGMGNSMTQAGMSATKGSTSASDMGGMSGMSGNAMGNTMGGGMSDVLRIQMERAELEDNLKNLLSARQVAEAQFNALLNRPAELPVIVPDSLEQKLFEMDHANALNRILTDNPMVTMLEAEADAYRAKAKMDKRMSMPMIGIGIQYSPMRKMESPMGMPGMNGKDMWMPMLKVSLPIFRKKYNAQQRESRLYWKASELKRDNVQNQLRTEYINLYSQLEDAGRKVDLYSRQFALSKTAWQLMVQEFAAGRQSLTDVIAVERQLLDYKLKKSEAIATYNTGVAAMEKLVSNSLNSEER